MIGTLIQKIAYMMRDSISQSEPKLLGIYDMHTPYIQSEEEIADLTTRIKISIARCARVSYLTHDGKRDISADINLFDRLKNERHMSPFEHVARPAEKGEEHLTGNFTGWVQYRKLLDNENIIQSPHPLFSVIDK